MAEFIIISKEELDFFKEDLLSQLKTIQESTPQSKWLRSKDVRKMLGISDATLQTLRINGSIQSYKLGSSWYYKHDEIIAALEAGKVKGGQDNG